MQRNNAEAAKVKRLPKIHTSYTNMPQFRPIIYATAITHCLVGKYLVNR